MAWIKRIILVCLHCEWSLCVRRGDLPTCQVCKLEPNWRVAIVGEVTKRDRWWLASCRISADDPAVTR